MFIQSSKHDKISHFRSFLGFFKTPRTLSPAAKHQTISYFTENFHAFKEYFPIPQYQKLQLKQKGFQSLHVKFNFWQGSNSCYGKSSPKIICFRYEESIFAILIVEAGRKNFPSATYLAYFDVFSTTVALQINIKSLGLDLQALAHKLFVPFGIKTQNKPKFSARKSREI